MFTWICQQCGREVPPAYNECPDCSGKEKAPAAAAPAGPAAAPQSPARPDALLAWMGSLADPTRLRILRVLEREELSVIELCEVLKLPQSTVSRHLKTLGGQRWVESRREGTATYYRMSAALDAAAKL